MKQKIEWYQEVLELEPGSKVFFPLARLLVEDGQIDAAIATLRHGVERHPEFVEARLYLVELLHTNGQDDVCTSEAERLASMFSAYPSFWSAWGALAFHFDNAPQGTALLLLAAALRDKRLSWDEIIEQGIRTMSGGMPVDAAAQSVARPAGVATHAAPAISPDTASGEPLGTQAAEPDSTPENPVMPQAAPAVSPIPVFTAEPAVTAAQQEADDDEGDEHLSVRTRSMAEVLVEQGDLRGAKEIYEELLEVASDERARAELEHRIAELESRLQASGLPQRPEEPAPAAAGKNKVVNMLQLLASRLEDRAN